MPPIVTWLLNRVDEMRAVVPKDINQLIDAFAGRTTALDEQVTSRMLAPTVVEKRCTTDTAINSGAETDITGATITLTPAIASMALVLGTFDIDGGTAVDIFVGLLDVDGTNEGAAVVYGVPTAGGDRKSLCQHWIVPLTAASHTLKLQAYRASGTGSATVVATHTKLTVILLGDANVTNDTSS